MGDQDRALIPALWPVSVRISLKEFDTEKILIEASAEAVARRVPSGENLADVMPRAWAVGRVCSGRKESRGFVEGGAAVVPAGAGLYS